MLLLFLNFLCRLSSRCEHPSNFQISPYKDVAVKRFLWDSNVWICELFDVKYFFQKFANCCFQAFERNTSIYLYRSTYFSSIRQIHAVDPFETYLVVVDRIGRCTSSRHVILWCLLISIHHFNDSTPLSGGD